MEIKSKIVEGLYGVTEPQSPYRFDYDDAQLKAAQELLERYENHERLSLLYLALWKWTCFLLPEETEKKNHATLNEEDWNELKKKWKGSKEAKILMDHVVPFIIQLKKHPAGSGE